MYNVVSCNGYVTLARAATLADAVRVARECADESRDDWAVVVMHDGRIVADVEDGVHVYAEGAPPYDAATATGMYDSW